MHPILEGVVASSPVLALAAVDVVTSGLPTSDIFERYGIMAVGIGGLWVAYQRLVGVLLKALSANTQAMNDVASAVAGLTREVRENTEDMKAIDSRVTAIEAAAHAKPRPR